MDLLTLDTNALRDWAWCEDKTSEKRFENNLVKKKSLRRIFDKLRAMKKDGKCELGITTQIYTDYGKSPGELPGYIEEMIGKYADISLSSPSISTFPWAFPFVFANKDEIFKLFIDVFPNSKPNHKKYYKNYKDALQLYAHKIAGRDYFITTDATILRAKDILGSKWSIKIKTPESYISLLSKT